jgi:hypothetical protein
MRPVEIFHDEPLLVLALLKETLAHVRLGPETTASLADRNPSDHDPEEIKSVFADDVFVFHDGRRIAIAAEVQTTSPDHARSLK